MLQTIKKIIPNTLTSCNLIAGCIATFHAFTGNVDIALLWIVIGAVFDFFDGMSARLLHVSSPIGKELDSLADDITFGLAPAAILGFELTMVHYPAFLMPVSDYIPFAAFVMAAFSALRLAKFNLDERQSMGFIGLPTPANALGAPPAAGADAAELLSAHSRDTHVCTQVQALGMGRKPAEVHLHPLLHPHPARVWSSWHIAHHRVVHTGLGVQEFH